VDDGDHDNSSTMFHPTVIREVCAMELPIDFTIRPAGATDPETLRTYARRRLEFALRRFENRVRHVIVRLGDINGPKRGVDSRCSITLRLRDGGAPIDVDAVTTWPFASITLAAKRLNAALRHDLERAHVRVRRPPRGPVR
jgi:putative sigma-54 modulation protein